VHLAYIWIISHLSAKKYRNWWKFDEVLTKTNLLSFFGTRCISCVLTAFDKGGDDDNDDDDDDDAYSSLSLFMRNVRGIFYFAI